MANYLVTDTELTSVADAIRTKGGTSASLEFPGDFVTAIGNISGGSTLGTKTITANDTYDASDDSLDGYSQVTVSVPASAVDTGTKSISTNGTHDVTGYASASVSVPASAVDTGTKSISTNGTHDVTGYASASVSVPTGTARSSSDLTANNLTVTAPAGLYAEAATKTLSDENLSAGNIKKDVTIFGTTGTYEGGGSVSGYGDPYTMMYGQSNYFALGGVNYLFLDVNNRGKRRSVWASSGEHSANLYVSSSNYTSSAGVYPIPVPSGATKVTISPDRTNQVIVGCLYYSNRWEELSNTAWLNPPVSEYSLSPGTTHIRLSLRVNESNTDYAYDNQPKTVEITFS